MTAPDRKVIDLDNPEQLAEAAMLGAVDRFEFTMSRLAQLGRAHTELLAHQRTTADRAQALALELEAARAEVGGVRAMNSHLRSLITTGRLREMNGPVPISGPEASDLVLAAAHTLAASKDDTIGLMLSAAVNACLLSEHPRGALWAAAEIFAAALMDVEHAEAAADGAARAEGEPS